MGGSRGTGRQWGRRRMTVAKEVNNGDDVFRIYGIVKEF